MAFRAYRPSQSETEIVSGTTEADVPRAIYRGCVQVDREVLLSWVGAAYVLFAGIAAFSVFNTGVDVPYLPRLLRWLPERAVRLTIGLFETWRRVWPWYVGLLPLDAILWLTVPQMHARKLIKRYHTELRDKHWPPPYEQRTLDTAGLSYEEMRDRNLAGAGPTAITDLIVETFQELMRSNNMKPEKVLINAKKAPKPDNSIDHQDRQPRAVTDPETKAVYEWMTAVWPDDDLTRKRALKEGLTRPQWEEWVSGRGDDDRGILEESGAIVRKDKSYRPAVTLREAMRSIKSLNDYARTLMRTAGNTPLPSRDGTENEGRVRPVPYYPSRTDDEGGNDENGGNGHREETVV